MASSQPSIESLLANPVWHEERKALAALLRDCGLAQQVKWGKLCYTFQGSNAAIIYGLKNYCAVGFFKGALLHDPNKTLHSPGENSQAMRQIRFTALDQIVAQTPVIKGFVADAIAVETSGQTIDFKHRHALAYPDELQARLDEDPEFQTAFDALTPGRQRGYVLHFSGAKQAATRVSRIEKCAPRILAGKGMTDR